MKNIVPLWIGTNDILPDEPLWTGTIAYNKLKTLYATLVGMGCIPVVITMTPRNGGTGDREVQRLIFNNLIRTDLNCPYIVDTDLIPETMDSTSLTYYNAGQLHPTAALNVILANYIAAKIAEIP